MIREVSPSDYNDMEDVFRTSVRTLCKGHYDDDVIQAWTGEYRPERFAESVEQGNQQFVFTINNKVVCFGSLHIEKQLLVSLFVAPEVAGTGVGHTMMQFLLDKAVSCGAQQLSIDSSLNAFPFYAKYGFKETGRSKYKTQSGNYVESIQMLRVFSSTGSCS